MASPGSRSGSDDHPGSRFSTVSHPERRARNVGNTMGHHASATDRGIHPARISAAPSAPRPHLPMYLGCHPEPMQPRSKVHATTIQSPCDFDPKSMRPRSKARATTTQSPCDLDPKSVRHDPKSVRLRSKVHATSIQGPCDFDPRSMRLRSKVHARSIQSACASLDLPIGLVENERLMAMLEMAARWRCIPPGQTAGLTLYFPIRAICSFPKRPRLPVFYQGSGKNLLLPSRHQPSAICSSLRPRQCRLTPVGWGQSLSHLSLPEPSPRDRKLH
jgi:hypothetical protein